MLFETTLNDLLINIEKGFPNTQYRQDSTDSIKIKRIEWIPFVGLKTLYVKGLAQNENREYNPTILFKNIIYSSGEGINLRASDGKEYKLKKINANENNVLVRCNCKDFFYRFHHYNYEDKSLYGRDRVKYIGSTGLPANPMEVSGMCKHIIKLTKTIQEAQLLL